MGGTQEGLHVDARLIGCAQRNGAPRRSEVAPQRRGRPSSTRALGRTEMPTMSTLTASVDLLPVSASVPAARHLTVDLMRAWGVPQDRDDAALLVTDLGAGRLGRLAADSRRRRVVGPPG